MSRLAAHNVANFVVARALGRASPEQLSEACQELRDSWAKIISKWKPNVGAPYSPFDLELSRSGVLKAVIDRAATLHNSEKEIGEVSTIKPNSEDSCLTCSSQAICTAFELETPEDYNMFVPCVMVLKPLSVSTNYDTYAVVVLKPIFCSNIGQSWQWCHQLRTTVKMIKTAPQKDGRTALITH